MTEAIRPKTRMEHIEEAIAKLASNQLHVTTKLDELIHRIIVLEARRPHSPTPSSSSSVKTFLTHTLIPFLSLTPSLPSPLKPTLSPMLSSLPMPTPPPHLAVMPKHPARLPTLFPMPVPHLATNSKHQVAHASSFIFNKLGHARVVASLDNLSCIVVHYGREAAPHDKLLEHSDMTLFKRGVVPYGSAMVARECQPAAFALGMTVDPKEPRRYRPWDPGGPRRTRNTLRTRCFRMGIEML